MILTGKCKEKFLEWLTKGMSDFARGITINDFELKYNIEQNALIVEWFDSIGLWDQEFYNVYIESTPTTEFRQIIERTIINLNRNYNEKFSL